jgi:ABC-type transport system substrate-binding protein
VLSIAGKYWGFRRPSELGAAARYWNHDVAEAKRLLAAAGVNLPLELTMPHWNATVVGQKHVDAATLIQSQWRSAGIANVRTSEVTFAQSQSTYAIGNYDSLCFAPNPIGYDPRMGTQLRYYFWSPPEGIKGPPTTNNGYVNNPELSMLIMKQLTQLDKEERVKTLRRIEEILAEQQYRLTTVTSTFNYFGDRTVKNMQTPRDAYNGALPYVKYWWFEDGKAP